TRIDADLSGNRSQARGRGLRVPLLWHCHLAFGIPLLFHSAQHFGVHDHDPRYRVGPLCLVHCRCGLANVLVPCSGRRRGTFGSDGRTRLNIPVKPRVVIYSDHLLYPSETFIQAQAGALREYEPVFAGSRRVAGLQLQQEQVYTVNPGSLRGKILELRFKILGSAPALSQRLSALRPVLMHAHYGPNGLWALPLARKLQVPLIITFHGSDVAIKDLRYQKASLGFRYYFANKGRLRKSKAVFLAVSKFVRQKLLEQGFPPENIFVQYTGVDIRKFRPSSTENRPITLFVGRMVEFKGPAYFIRAASEVQKQFPAAELVIIGDGPLRKGLERLAKQSLCRYSFLGVRTPEEVRDWMNRAS